MKKTNDLNKKSRIAGLLYFVFFLISIFYYFYVPAKIIVAGNTAATIKNILAQELLFRGGIAANIIGQIIFIFLALVLYQLFQEVNKNQARTMLALVIASVPIAFVVILNQVSVLILIHGTNFLKAFTPQQIQALVQFFLTSYDYGMLIIGVFWGLWLFPFGYLTYKSGFLPKILGGLLILGGVCYLIDSFTFLLTPAYHDIVTQIITVPLALGEFAMIFWLLLRGAK